MTMFLSRSAWNASPPNRQSADRTSTTHLFVHHSATPKPATVDEAKAQWLHFQADHLQRPISMTNPTLWADIAYNVGVGPGVILEGRGWDAKGGGTGPGQRVPHPSGSWDNISVSICVIGNYQTEQLDAATRGSLVEALDEAHTRYGDLIVMGDRDVNFTSCCGDNLYSQLPVLWAEAIGDDMALTDDDVRRIAEAVWSRMIDAADWQAPAGQFFGALRDEIIRDDKLTKRVADAVAAHGGVVSGGSTPGQVAEELGRRLTTGAP